MKILHLMLACFYIDKFSYQENLLPKYHKKSGHDVEIVASLFSFDENGNGKWLKKTDRYLNEHGIPVTRLEFKKGKFSARLRRYVGLERELERIKPDLIFVHGVQFCDIDVVVKHLKKHPEVKVYADNHSDFSNSAKGWVSKNILHKIIWRGCANKILPYTEKFYGVLPARVDFLIDVYKLPNEKCELLVMGADDDKVAKAQNDEVRKSKREEYGISNDDIVIMTGGKIDHNKPQTLLLMKAVNLSKNPRLKLLVFGSVIENLKEEFEYLLSDKVKYIGWKQSEDIYSEFEAADIIAFPGLHSVLWEQAVGMGKPCVFRKIAGFDHIDLGGNCKYFIADDTDEYLKVIEDCVCDLENMSMVAREKGMNIFSYNNIAKNSIGG